MGKLSIFEKYCVFDSFMPHYLSLPSTRALGSFFARAFYTVKIPIFLFAVVAVVNTIVVVIVSHFTYHILHRRHQSLLSWFLYLFHQYLANIRPFQVKQHVNMSLLDSTINIHCYYTSPTITCLGIVSCDALLCNFLPIFAYKKYGIFTV